MRFCMLCCVTLLFSAFSTLDAQTGNRLVAGNKFWTLPATECDGDNFCEVRISPQGTIYGWDKFHRKLYVSHLNQESYDIYDLSGYAKELIGEADFIPFESEGYVVFFYGFAQPSVVKRYNFITQNLDTFNFPPGYKPITCNQVTAVLQRTIRFIYQVGVDGKMVACSTSPENRPVIHIINVSTKTIEKTLDVVGWLDDTGRPQWRLAGGLDNKIYLMKRNPQDTILNLPEIDPLTQEIVLIYDVSRDTWSYKIRTRDSTSEILSAMPYGIFSQNYESAGKGVVQFNSDFEIMRRFGLNFGIYQGMTLDGDVFFSNGDHYTDMRVVNIQDYPLLIPPINTGTLTPTSTATPSG